MNFQRASIYIRGMFCPIPSFNVDKCERQILNKMGTNYGAFSFTNTTIRFTK